MNNSYHIIYHIIYHIKSTTGLEPPSRDARKPSALSIDLRPYLNYLPILCSNVHADKLEFGEKNRTDYSLLFKLTTPFIIAATEIASTASIIAALVIADKVSISEPSPFIFTIISVF